MTYRTALRSVTGTAAATPLRVVNTPGSSEDQTASEAILAEFETHMRASNNRHGRPYAEASVISYVKAVKTLAKWLTATGNPTPLTAMNTPTLNAFFKAYWSSHDGVAPDSTVTSGTAAVQASLRKFLAWTELEYGTQDPYEDKRLVRYHAPRTGKPKTLSRDFVGDILKHTSGGRPTNFKDFQLIRNHAIVWLLTEGVRAEELVSLRLEDLHLTDNVLQVKAIKGARATGVGRMVHLQPSTRLAITRYLKVRKMHPRADSAWLWLGTRGRGQLKYPGLYDLVKRLALQCGYDPAQVSPHSWRHTAADDLMRAGVSDNDTMSALGWSDPAQLRRYAHDQAASRAQNALAALGDRY